MTHRRKTVLVTGGTGFIGRAVVEALVAKKYRVRVLARKKPAEAVRGVSYAQGDLLMPSSLTDLLTGVSVVVHLAGNAQVNYAILHPGEVLLHNTTMLVNLLEAAKTQRRPTRIIFASTDRMYGNTRRRRVSENEPPYPIEPYTASKIVGETILESYRHLYGIPYISLRMDGVYGPGQPPRMFISDVIQKMMQGGLVRVGNLSVRKNFVFVEDVAEAFVQAVGASAEALNTVYSIGAMSASLRDIVRILKDLLERKYRKTIMLAYDPALVRASGAEVSAFALNLEKSKKLLRWHPRTVLSDGLEKTLEYFSRI